MDFQQLTISKHAKERYAERIMKKEGFREAFVFITENDIKICSDIKKMLEYSELVYRGPSVTFGKDKKSRETEVYISGIWVIIVSPEQNKVITLFSIDLGLGDDFNKDYVNRLLEKLSDAKARKAEIEAVVLEEIATYEDLIKQNDDQINEYKRIINGLEELSLNYQDVADGLKIKIEKADKDIRDAVAILIGKKIF